MESENLSIIAMIWVIKVKICDDQAIKQIYKHCFIKCLYKHIVLKEKSPMKKELGKWSKKINTIVTFTIGKLYLKQKQTICLHKYFINIKKGEWTNGYW